MTAPEVFDLDNATNLAVVRAGRPVDDDRSAVEEAVADCPTRAIRLVED
jgi:ferredoxin